MLEYIWFFILMTTSIVLAIKGARTADFSDSDSDPEATGLCSIIFSYLTASLAIALSWRLTGAVLTNALLDHLPKFGSLINYFTASVYFAIAALFFAIIIPTLVMWATPRPVVSPSGSQRKRVLVLALSEFCIFLACVFLVSIWMLAPFIIFFSLHIWH